jgi:nitrile hydratase
MDGIHDLGGMHGFGPVELEVDEPVFHADWERRALGVTMSSFAMALSTAGQFRHSIERMDPAHYLGSRYYEHWITGLASRLVESGQVSWDELEDRAGGPFPLSRPVVAERIEHVDETQAEPRFEVGTRVRVREAHSFGHTRCPRYVRGKVGVVVRLDGSWSLPDVEAHSTTRCHEPTYSVRFDAAELWGDRQTRAAVHVDLWESYLEAV